MKTRKVDDNIVLQLLREGKNQKQIAEHFNVSNVAIHKRLKKILPKPESLEKLTHKEQKFCLAVAEGKSRINAVMEAYDVTSRESAKALQNQLMEKDDIRIAIDELLQIFGLTKGYRINRLRQHIDHPDPNVSLKGLDMSWKLSGDYAPDKHINVNFDAVAASEKIAKLREALAEYEAQHPEAEGD